MIRAVGFWIMNLVIRLLDHYAFDRNNGGVYAQTDWWIDRRMDWQTKYVVKLVACNKLKTIDHISLHPTCQNKTLITVFPWQNSPNTFGVPKCSSSSSSSSNSSLWCSKRWLSALLHPRWRSKSSLWMWKRLSIAKYNSLCENQRVSCQRWCRFRHWFKYKRHWKKLWGFHDPHQGVCQIYRTGESDNWGYRKQDLIHGYSSRLWVGRGNIWGQWSIWAGEVKSMTS